MGPPSPASLVLHVSLPTAEPTPLALTVPLEPTALLTTLPLHVCTHTAGRVYTNRTNWSFPKHSQDLISAIGLTLRGLILRGLWWKWRGEAACALRQTSCLLPWAGFVAGWHKRDRVQRPLLLLPMTSTGLPGREAPEALRHTLAGHLRHHQRSCPPARGPRPPSPDRGCGGVGRPARPAAAGSGGCWSSQWSSSQHLAWSRSCRCWYCRRSSPGRHPPGR